MKKALRIISIIFLGFILLLFIGYLALNEAIPEGTPSAEADELARKVELAMNKAAWDATPQVSWTFKGGHQYEWDKQAHVVNVKWEENEVILEPATQSGVVLNGENYSAEESTALINTAWDFFNNDSFWLCAPYKLFDPGTERSLVTLKDGREGLMITYTSGGSTPGDSYVWILDDDYMPVAIKMWVSILPIGGMEFTWENYQTLSTGAMVAQDHFLFGKVNIDITNLSASMAYFEGIFEKAFSPDIALHQPRNTQFEYRHKALNQNLLNDAADWVQRYFDVPIKFDSSAQAFLSSIETPNLRSKPENPGPFGPLSVEYSSPFLVKPSTAIIVADYNYSSNSSRRTGSLNTIIMGKSDLGWMLVRNEPFIEF